MNKYDGVMTEAADLVGPRATIGNPAREISEPLDNQPDTSVM